MVAEKPSLAQAIAKILSKGGYRVKAVSISTQWKYGGAEMKLISFDRLTFWRLIGFCFVFVVSFFVFSEYKDFLNLGTQHIKAWLACLS